MIVKNNFYNKFFIKFSEKNNLLQKIIFGIVFSFLFLFFSIFTLFHNGLEFVNLSDIVDKTLLYTLTAIITGFGISFVGCSMQSITRNELAGPTTLGFLPASSLGILVYNIIDFNKILPNASPIQLFPFMLLFSFLFSFIILVINLITMKSKINYTSKNRMILVGLILSMLVTTISSMLVALIPKINATIVPLIGIIDINITWDRASYVFPLITIFSLIILSQSNKLNIIQKNYLLAKTLGININLVNWICGISSLIIVSSSVSLIGSITLIGIVIPHLTRMIFKTTNNWAILPVSGFISSTLLIIALWINRLFTFGVNFFLAIVLLPLFIYLIIRKKETNYE